MHVTACLAGQEGVAVEVGEECRSLQALKESIVEALPQLCVEGFDVSVGGRALDDAEGAVFLTESACLDVVPNTRIRSLEALREAGREVGDEGLLAAARDGDLWLCKLYLDAGAEVDCVDHLAHTPLHYACRSGHLSVATLLLDRGSRARDAKSHYGTGGYTPLIYSCRSGHVSLATLLLDRGCAIDEPNHFGYTPLQEACRYGHLSIATLLLDRGSCAINEKDVFGATPLQRCCRHVAMVTLLLDRGCDVDVEAHQVHNETNDAYPQEVLETLLARGYDVRPRSLFA